MQLSYQVEIYTPDGLTRLGFLDGFTTAQWTRQVNTVGKGVLTISTAKLPTGVVDVDNQIRRDLRILPYRAWGNDPMSLLMDTAWLARGISYTESRIGEMATIRMADGVDLLRRRIVASAADTAGSRKTGAADVVMKDFCDEAFGPSAIAARQFAGVTIQADQTIGQTITKAAAWRNLLQTLQEICDDSAQAGTYLAFDVVAISPSVLEVQVFANQRGQDRRTSLPIGTDFGNLTDVLIDYAADDEVTFAYAGGQGEGVDRVVTGYGDTARMAASPYNRIEDFLDSRNTTVTADLTNDARAAVRGGRPSMTMQGKLISTASTRFGRDYGFGDYIRAQTRRGSFDARIDALQVTVQNGVETVDAQLWSDDNV